MTRSHRSSAAGTSGPFAILVLGVLILAAAVLPAARAQDSPAAPSEDLAPLPLELPHAVFDGTPPGIPTDVRIDRKRPKDRPPFMAPKGIKNLAFGKPVISSDSNPVIGSLDLITDGDKEALDGRMVEMAPGKQWVQIDLGAEAQMFAIVFWHNHMQPRVYRDVVVQVSNDPEFKEGVTVVYNNDHDNSLGAGVGDNFEFFETKEGELVPVAGLKARYVRLWSNGSTMDDQNHYSEVEVWGRPATQ
jgi:hypothetical protein